MYAITLIDLFFGLVILVSLDPNSLLFRSLTFKPLRQLGQISYGFYVFHDIPHLFYAFLVRRYFPHAAGVSRIPMTPIVALVGTLLLSILSFRFFEAPFLRLKERLTV